MPRALGQIDTRKDEAILEAASQLFGARGLSVSMDEIARQAGVSKQTLYNRYASKVEIARAVAARRSEAISAPLATDGSPVEVLEALALRLLEKLCCRDAANALRAAALASIEAPELGRAVYEAGAAESRRRLADWLAEQTRRGRLGVDDPAMAAEMFSGMVLGHGHLRGLLGLQGIAPDQAKVRARACAERFVRAFAP
ncbi:MAG: TetR/AcrR family transcriptional regulator [Caulobacteraceae bacterium]|nr:TetR/AcrR family transcriptional regulator [Caulobacteraceae bacterium]